MWRLQTVYGRGTVHIFMETFLCKISNSCKILVTRHIIFIIKTSLFMRSFETKYYFCCIFDSYPW